ncbi:hypothetical protein K440DRAFT_609263 [Wilcoxina mikolae CBS 423.85]|nr:hypothetical protein K440DRAFT_609263 [Wilcoxina mikolae CBS 423.85]
MVFFGRIRPRVHGQKQQTLSPHSSSLIEDWLGRSGLTMLTHMLIVTTQPIAFLYRHAWTDWFLFFIPYAPQ